jgi:hypothetical protein
MAQSAPPIYVPKVLVSSPVALRSAMPSSIAVENGFDMIAISSFYLWSFVQIASPFSVVLCSYKVLSVKCTPTS